MYEITDLTQLPSIHRVMLTSRGLALLDAVMTPEWQYRYFSFNADWAGDGKQAMASMRDGTGSDYFLLFDPTGVAGKIYCSGQRLSVDAVEELPDSFSNFKGEAAFCLDASTYFIWRGYDDDTWHATPAGLDKYDWLSFLMTPAETYHAWAERYYDRDLDLNVVRDVIVAGNIQVEQVMLLNLDLNFEDFATDVAEITGRSL